MSLNRYLVILCAVFTVLSGCTQKNRISTRQPIVIALSSDVDTFNPLFASDATAGELNELLYPSLVSPTFDTAAGELHFSPSLARSFEHANAGCDIVFHLRSNVFWSDSVPITAFDVQKTFALYADPQVGSVRQSAVEGFLRKSDGTVDIEKSIQIIDDTTLIFHFRQTYPGQLFDAGLPLLPAHIFDKIPPAELRTHAINRTPVGAGPYLVKSWKPMQEIVFEPNPLSPVIATLESPSLIFRIISDYRSQVNQLKSGEVDMLLNLEAADAASFAAGTADISLLRIPGRRYHFIGWSTIDQRAYAASAGKTITPHPLFGDAAVRRALTFAIDRRKLLNVLLNDYGVLTVGPIAPFFHWAFNDSLQPYLFSPQEARAQLRALGWMDNDRDGILEKSGRKFSFSLYVPTGSPFWSSVATIVQQEFRAVNIEAKIEHVERAVYWQSLLEKKYDAWIAGFEVPLQMQLQEFWSSDLQRNPFNISSYQNARVDRLLAEARFSSDPIESGPMWRELQSILHRDQPFTFLFWEDRIVAMNKRVRGTAINVLGTFQSAPRWSK
ncbi:MAG: ABC transporter substrate-binding protein [Ignavibacteriales bacterium]|nr:ABC transporter substrate-binding protein [Ignavibacteriales bacterium]